MVRVAPAVATIVAFNVLTVAEFQQFDFAEPSSALDGAEQGLVFSWYVLTTLSVTAMSISQRYLLIDFVSLAATVLAFFVDKHSASLLHLLIRLGKCSMTESFTAVTALAFLPRDYALGRLYCGCS